MRIFILLTLSYKSAVYSKLTCLGTRWQRKISQNHKIMHKGDGVTHFCMDNMSFNSSFCPLIVFLGGYVFHVSRGANSHTTANWAAQNQRVIKRELQKEKATFLFALDVNGLVGPYHISSYTINGVRFY